MINMINKLHAWQRCDIMHDNMTWQHLPLYRNDTQVKRRQIDTYRTFAGAYLSADYSCRMTSKLHALAPFCTLATRRRIDGRPHLRRCQIDPKRYRQTTIPTTTIHTSRDCVTYWPRLGTNHAPIAAMLSQTSPTNRKFFRPHWRHLLWAI